jgi:hypothetical protein
MGRQKPTHEEETTIRSHEHQNHHREAIMSYGFILIAPFYMPCPKSFVRTSWLVTEWPQSKNVPVSYIPQMGESRSA